MQKNIFVIQEHHATHLHYDFRLEIGGVLKSWVLPKKPSSDSNIKRLAIETENHPLSYAKFHGTIPKGNYGAGVVKIYDRGKFDNLKDYSMQQSYKKGVIEFRLHGKHLKGNFALIKFRSQNKSWLFKKIKD